MSHIKYDGDCTTLSIRLPKKLKQDAAKMARIDRRSLGNFIVKLVEEKLEGGKRG